MGESYTSPNPSPRATNTYFLQTEGWALGEILAAGMSAAGISPAQQPAYLCDSLGKSDGFTTALQEEAWPPRALGTWFQ